MEIYCYNCSIHFDAEVLHDYEVKVPDDPMEDFKYSFLKCPRCSLPIIVLQDRVFGINTIQWSNPTQIYPKAPYRINPEIPMPLRKSLDEAIGCLNSKAYTASTIMCRRILDGFCQLKNIKKSNLKKSINELHKQEIISDHLLEWAHELRLIGNEAAQNIEIEFTRVDASDSLEFTIAILDYTYSYKEKFEKFKSRKKGATK